MDLTEPQELKKNQDGDVQGQVSVSGHTSKVYHVVQTCSVSILDDNSADEKDTSLTQQNGKNYNIIIQYYNHMGPPTYKRSVLEEKFLSGAYLYIIH
jgi:hypothetical protein